MSENEISYAIIGKAIKVHKKIGPGLLESAYQMALADELRMDGFDVKTEVPIPFENNGEKKGVAFKIDMLINDKVLIELKAVEKLAPVHFSQTLTYVKLSGVKLGLLINFNSNLIKNNVHRLVNNL